MLLVSYADRMEEERERDLKDRDVLAECIKKKDKEYTRIIVKKVTKKWKFIWVRRRNYKWQRKIGTRA